MRPGSVGWTVVRGLTTQIYKPWLLLGTINHCLWPVPLPHMINGVSGCRSVGWAVVRGPKAHIHNLWLLLGGDKSFTTLYSWFEYLSQKQDLCPHMLNWVVGSTNRSKSLSTVNYMVKSLFTVTLNKYPPLAPSWIDSYQKCSMVKNKNVAFCSCNVLRFALHVVGL